MVSAASLPNRSLVSATLAHMPSENLEAIAQFPPADVVRKLRDGAPLDMDHEERPRHSNMFKELSLCISASPKVRGFGSTRQGAFFVQNGWRFGAPLENGLEAPGNPPIPPT